MGEWKEYKLSEIATIVDCEHKTAQLVEESEYTSVRTTDIKNGRIDFENANRVSLKTYLEWTKRMVPSEGDIILAREAPVGEVGYVLKNKKVCLGQRTVLIKLNKNCVDPKYLLYYLTNSETKNDLISRSTGSVVEHLNVKDIKEFPITVRDSIAEQKSIALVLYSLDDKIDLLHRQNKTLEALAETLFRQWFAEEAEEGWEEIILADIADHVKLSINPAKQPTTLFEHYSIPAFDEGQEPKKELGNAIRSNKYSVLSNTILVSKLNPKTPRVWAIYGEIDENRSICSTEFQVIKPRRADYFGFIYCYLKSWNVMQELANAVGGTSGSHQRVNPADIFNLTLRQPPLDKLKKFDRIANDYWVKISRNRKQIHILTRLRDTLLPKLMSGEINIKGLSESKGGRFNG